MINKTRQKIDSLDAELVKLFEQRLDLVTTIADYKKKHGLAINDINREQDIIMRATQQLNNSNYAPLLIDFFNNLLAITKTYQQHYTDEK